MNLRDVFLGLGSNLGERQVALQNAAKAIGRIPDVKIVWGSPVYETEPYGNSDQPAFLNAALQVETILDPAGLFQELQQIEKEVGRKEGERWGPREIDIDILVYDGLVFDEANLRVPHPDIERRKFVLVPLNDIAPDLVHPVSGLTVSEMLRECRSGGSVVRSIHSLKV
ncbi:MAG: 2-amino-4-hydroxy-6-hydroxymethyldihydropteridine diphosphokinase [Ignavibacteria bacterium]|nr:2-amino-4-hydroxy-6-hydroxymethyldihydropteridine diphosphokinase [Ignavibacteria bacterium]